MLPLVLAALVHCESLSDETLQLALGYLALVYFVTQPWLGNKVGNAGFDTPFVGIRYSWLVRFQFFLSTESIPEHGYTKYKGRPWKLTGNDVPVLPHRYLDESRKLPPHRASAMKANLDSMQGKYTHLEVLNSTRLFVNVLKWKVNPQLAILVPTVPTELDAAFAHELPPTINEEEWTRVLAIHTLTLSSGASRRESSAGVSCAMATAGSPWPRATSRTSLSPPSPFVWCPKGSRRSSPGSCRARGRSCGGSGTLNVSCSSLKLHYYAGILNAVHDVLISCLPQRIIWNLHLVARKRLARHLDGDLKIAYIQGDKSDSCRPINPKPPPKCFLTQGSTTADSIAPALIFYAMEPLLASICSCLPAIPYFFRHVRLDSFHQLSILVRSLNTSKKSGINNSRNNSRYPSSKGTSTDAITELAKRSGEVV
ncbi:hypothetical protein AARAC_004499 [Aspergillus arachidicola]|uniref:Cytochrome P450 n=1 Tax=Aspergillus arachidicola TaxID=656916 RepID=A0A2G7FZ97_9EURO|nr:hypothetical protein AARAC_004499 [Aspergillus arachidicola]